MQPVEVRDVVVDLREAVLPRHPGSADLPVVLVVEARERLGNDEESAIPRERASLVEELRSELAVAVKKEPQVIERSVHPAQSQIARGAGNGEVVALGLHRRAS